MKCKNCGKKRKTRQGLCEVCRAGLDNRIKSTVFIILFAFIFCISGISASALTGNLSTILDDTYVSSDDASSHASSTTAYIQIPTSRVFDHRGLVKWNSAALKGKIINDANVYFYFGYSEGSADVGVYDIQTQAWSESVLWAQNPCGATIEKIQSPCNGTTANGNKTIAELGWLSFNITGALNRAATANWDNFSLAMMEKPSTNQKGWNTKETHSQPYVLYDYSNPVAIQVPNITINYPTQNGTHENRISYPVKINGTVQSPDGIYNVSVDYSLYYAPGNNPWNVTSNQTSISNTYITFQFIENTVQNDGNYTFIINSTNIGGASAIYTNFYIDTVNPVISISPQGACIDVQREIGSLASDANLYRHTSSLYRQNMTSLSPPTYKNLEWFASTENINIVSTTDMINHSITPLIDAHGIYRFETNASDSHTSAIIPEYEIKPEQSQKEISFSTKGNEITFKLVEMFFAEEKSEKPPIEISNDFISMDAIKSPDKYSIQIPFLKDEAQPKGLYFYKFMLSAAQPIIKVAKNTGYRGHFVSGNNWIDFEPYDVTVLEMDKNTWEISFYTDKKDISFNSLGELNTISSSGIYYLSNSNPVISGITPANNSVFNGSAISSIEINSTCYSPIGLRTANNFTINLNNATWSSADCNGQYLSNYTAMFINCNIPITSLAAGNYKISLTCFDTCSKKTALDYNINISKTYSSPPEAPPILPMNMTTALNYNECPSTSSNIMILGIIVIIALAMLFIGFAFDSQLVGAFGGVCFIFISFYMNACTHEIAYLMGIFGLVMAIAFLMNPKK